jgi:hypothetical protein
MRKRITGDCCCNAACGQIPSIPLPGHEETHLVCGCGWTLHSLRTGRILKARNGRLVLIRDKDHGHAWLRLPIVFTTAMHQTPDVYDDDDDNDDDDEVSSHSSSLSSVCFTLTKFLVAFLVFCSIMLAIMMHQDLRTSFFLPPKQDPSNSTSTNITNIKR